MADQINETVTYLVAMLRRIGSEMELSQSSRLAMGFLEFDRDRLLGEINAVVQVVKNSDPVDFPETHPKSLLEIVDE